MATSTIDLDYIILKDLWPGVPDPRYATPKDGFTGSDHHDVTTAAYPVGSKIQYYHPGVAGNAGYSTFIYLQLIAEDATNVLGAKHIVTVDDGAIPYGVTNEAATEITATYGPIAVALSGITIASYGWFWCGGVCPEDAVAALTGNMITNGDVTAGCRLVHRDHGTDSDTTNGEFMFSIAAAVTEEVIGYSLADDA
jgi:hypothetical protein